MEFESGRTNAGYVRYCIVSSLPHQIWQPGNRYDYSGDLVVGPILARIVAGNPVAHPEPVELLVACIPGGMNKYDELDYRIPVLVPVLG